MKELTVFERFEYVLKKIEESNFPENVKNFMRLGALKAYEKMTRKGEDE
jgi:hypothetical protein